MAKKQFVEAHFHRLALILEIEEAQSLVAWADAILLGDENLDKKVIDISLAGDDSTNLIHFLAELTAKAPFETKDNNGVLTPKRL